MNIKAPALATSVLAVAIVAVIGTAVPSWADDEELPVAPPAERIVDIDEGDSTDELPQATQALSKELETPEALLSAMSEDDDLDNERQEEPPVALSAQSMPLATQAGTAITTFEELKAAFSSVSGEVTLDIQANITVTESLRMLNEATITIVSTTGSTLTRGTSTARIFSTAKNRNIVLGEGLIVNAAYGSVSCGVGDITIDGSTIVDVGSSDDLGPGTFIVDGGGVFTLQSGSIEGGFLNNKNDCGIIRASGSTVRITGGKISGITCQQYASVVFLKQQSTLEMTGGSIENNNPYGGSSDSYEKHPFYGGAIHAMGQSKVSISGDASIRNNCAYYGGGVCLETGSSLELAGNASIEENHSYRFGGGIYLANSSANLIGGSILNNYATSFGGGVIANRGTTLVLDGTSIEGNEGDSGGGIYVGGTENVTLKSGRIVNNKARMHGNYELNGDLGYGTGGGITVANTTSGITMSDVLVTGNKAGTIGGGAWLCPTGDVDSEISDGVAMYGNEAAHAADDLAVVDTGKSHNVDVIQGRMLGGGVVSRYVDGQVDTSGSDVGDHGDGSGARYSNGRRDLFDYAHWDGTSSIALHNEPGPAADDTITEAEAAQMGENAKELARERATLVIEGNTAQNSGGGIASNGHLRVGKADSKKIAVKKAWSVPHGTQTEDSVTIYLDIDEYNETGESLRIEKITLSKDNNWTHVFEGLPPKAVANLQEAALSHPGWVAYYVEDHKDQKELDGETYYAEEDVTVTNARAGKLEISKKAEGDQADSSQEFVFEVSITGPDGKPYETRDANHHPTPLDIAYSGDVSGSLAGGSGVIRLKSGQKAVLDNIPHGATYTVKEAAETAHGYEIKPVRTSDGTVGAAAEEGAIQGDVTTAIAYTNIKGSLMGGLNVSKALAGDAADPSQLFHFQIRLYDSAGAEITDAEFPFTGDESGVVASGGTFPLKGGETVELSGVPAGTTWTVKEVAADAHGYEIEPVRGDVRGKAAEEGTIAAGAYPTLAYTNEKNTSMGSLSISKQVAGDGADKNREFEFKVTIGDSADTAIDDAAAAEFAYTGSREGIIANGGIVRLKHGEEITIEGIPEGTPYEVIEVKTRDYTASSTGASGKMAAGGSAKAAFTNTYTPPQASKASAANVKTGDALPIAGLTIAVLAAALIAAWAVHRMRARK